MFFNNPLENVMYGTRKFIIVNNFLMALPSCFTEPWSLFSPTGGATLKFTYLCKTWRLDHHNLYVQYVFFITLRTHMI